MTVFSHLAASKPGVICTNDLFKAIIRDKQSTFYYYDSLLPLAKLRTHKQKCHENSAHRRNPSHNRGTMREAKNKKLKKK